jgi:hypothetical protein
MAWAALIAGLCYPLLLLVTSSDQLGAIAGPFYIFVSAVVGAYVGFATVDDRWQHEIEANHIEATHTGVTYTEVNNAKVPE